jgi:hypothetical protein
MGEGMGYCNAHEEEWRRMCPQGCHSEEGNPMSLRPLLRVPFNPELFKELYIECFELCKSGKIIFNYTNGTQITISKQSPS